MKVEVKDNSARIIPEESIDLANAEKLEEKFNEIIKKDIHNIILDMKDTVDIDSMAAGKILFIHKKMREKGGNMVIENVTSDNIKDIFDMINLDEVIEIRN
ncbi:STAS domain-containing protein [Halarsenatibacter silvermanii]|uniref:STAS domain-containing protein n=1 Tax=Halarsenatibacter silvermanii TaxID=321763 RepID=A0A1G9R5E7_9FIRM|nr:STAS domain-containing protein [Halarsenatibacter silvermanii]SDM18351.1 STAS domain-containing protein [Halarsenatibacter silvermanii]